MYWNGHMSAAGWVISILWTVIVLTLVVGGVVWLTSSLGRGGNERASSGPEPSAQEILDRRLARGELTVDQYRQLQDVLGHRSPPPTGAVPAQASGPPS